MKLYVTNKFFSIGGSSSVTNENGDDVFIVEGKPFSISKIKYVTDIMGKILYEVRSKLFNILTFSAYVFDDKGNQLAKVERKFGLSNTIVVEGYKDEITIEGNVLGWTFDVYRNGQHIGALRRRLALTDSFVLETITEDDAAFMVALVIAIDIIFDSRAGN